MIESEKNFVYTVSEKALSNIASTAALGTSSIAGKKGRGIAVRNLDGVMTAEVHVQAYYGADLRMLALTVQKNVAQAIRIMAEPERLEVHVTIEDLVIKSDGHDKTGGQCEQA